LKRKVGFGLLATLLFVGCGKSTDPIHVQGTVTYRGQPVPKGYVLIHPDRQKGNSGPFGMAIIHSGKFDTKAQGGRVAAAGAVKFAVAGYANDGTASDYSDASPLFPACQIEREIGPDSTTVEIVVP
jgi:hypothetical protein